MLKPGFEIPSKNRSFEGICWMLASGLSFAVFTGIIRYLGSNLPAVENAFLRYLFGAIIMAPVLLRVFRNRYSARALGGFAMRGFIHSFGVILWFYSMARIPLAEVTAIGYTAPIFVTIGAAIFLGERLRFHRIFGCVCGLVGVVIILRPGLQEVSSGQIAQVIAAPIFAISYLMAKRLTGYAAPEVIVAMLSVGCTIFLLPGAIIQWQAPLPHEYFWLGISALIATIGHYTFTRALNVAPISATQPVSYLQLVWATLLGVTIFGEPIDPFVILGGSVIVASATYIAHRETRKT